MMMTMMIRASGRRYPCDGYGSNSLADWKLNASVHVFRMFSFAQDILMAVSLFSKFRPSGKAFLKKQSNLAELTSQSVLFPHLFKAALTAFDQPLYFLAHPTTTNPSIRHCVVQGYGGDVCPTGHRKAEGGTIQIIGRGKQVIGIPISHTKNPTGSHGIPLCCD